MKRKSSRKPRPINQFDDSGEHKNDEELRERLEAKRFAATIIRRAEAVIITAAVEEEETKTTKQSYDGGSNNNGNNNDDTLNTDPLDGEPLKTTNINSPKELLPFFRRNSNNNNNNVIENETIKSSHEGAEVVSVCCELLQNASDSVLSFPSETEFLLPILSLYFQEPDHKNIMDMAVVSGGERLTEEILGITYEASVTLALLQAAAHSPEKRFSTVLFYSDREKAHRDKAKQDPVNRTLPFQLMYSCEEKCRKSFAGGLQTLVKRIKNNFSFTEIFGADLSGYEDFDYKNLWNNLPMFETPKKDAEQTNVEKRKRKQNQFGPATKINSDENETETETTTSTTTTVSTEDENNNNNNNNVQQHHTIDVLFIRNSFLGAEAITRILEMFHSLVLRKIIIYNIFDNTPTPHVPYSSPNPGTYRSIKHFIEKYFLEWEEEITLFVNRGLIVLSKRKPIVFDHKDYSGYWKKWIHSPVARYSGFTAEVDLTVVKNIAKLGEEQSRKDEDRKGDVEHVSTHPPENVGEEEEEKETTKSKKGVQENSTTENVVSATSSSFHSTAVDFVDIQLQQCKSSFTNMMVMMLEQLSSPLSQKSTEKEVNLTLATVSFAQRPCAMTKFTTSSFFANPELQQQDEKEKPFKNEKHSLQQMYFSLLHTPEDELPIRFHLGAILAQLTSSMSMLYFSQRLAIHARMEAINAKDDLNVNPEDELNKPAIAVPMTEENGHPITVDAENPQRAFDLIEKLNERQRLGAHERAMPRPKTHPHLFKIHPLKVFIWGCELSVFISVTHGVSSMLGHSEFGIPTLSFFPSEYSAKNKNLLESYKTVCAANAEIDEFLSQHMLRKSDAFPFEKNKDVDILVISANILDEFSRNDPGKISELAGAVKRKVIIYGTSLVSLAVFDKTFTSRGLGKEGFFAGYNVEEVRHKMNNFELTSSFSSAVGLAVYERKRDLDVKWIPFAKKKFLEVEVEKIVAFEAELKEKHEKADQANREN